MSVAVMGHPRLIGNFLPHQRYWFANAQSRARCQFNRLVRRQLVIQSHYAGLGDNLFLSHLPRIAKETGAYEKVLVSNRCVFRDPAFRKLVWESNRHVDGFTDEPGFGLLPPHTQCRQSSRLYGLFFRLGLEARITQVRPGCNLLDEFMLGMGLDDGQRFHEPEVHLDIPRVKEYENLTVYDPNYITNVGAITAREVEAYFDRSGVEVHAQMARRNQSLTISRPTATITTKDLLDFCSVIVSCKALYCLTTGTATLAAALGKPCTVLYGEGINPVYHHSKLHQYVRL
jgi:hypothetical protein